jgi:hypothetical protein
VCTKAEFEKYKLLKKPIPGTWLVPIKYTGYDRSSGLIGLFHFVVPENWEENIGTIKEPFWRKYWRKY